MSFHKSSPIGALIIIARFSAVFSRTIRSLAGDDLAVVVRDDPAEFVADDLAVVVLDDLAVVAVDDLSVRTVDDCAAMIAASSESEPSVELLSSLSGKAISAWLSCTEPSSNEISSTIFRFSLDIPTLQLRDFESTTPANGSSQPSINSINYFAIRKYYVSHCLRNTYVGDLNVHTKVGFYTA